MKSTRALLLLILTLGACGSTASSSIDATATTPVDAASGPDARGNHEAIFARYGAIETIAGIGQIEGKGDNGWQSGFEGGAAVDAELSRPHIAEADGEGNVFVVDKDAHAIRKIDADGRISTIAGTSSAGNSGDGPLSATEMQLSAPNGLWLGTDGTLYVLDLGNDVVRRIREGTMQSLFAIGGAGTGRGLWVADDENLAYVAAGSTLKRWTPQGGIEAFATGFVSLGNFFVLPSGELLVADRGGHRVYRVTTAGVKTPIAGNGARTGGGDGQAALSTGLDEVRGVWGHPDGGYFVATHKGGQVWYVDGAGVIHLFVDGDADDSHAGDGLPFDDPEVRISEPRAVTVDPIGNVLITEHDGGFIRRVIYSAP
tara:strand:+ start:29050 stop:30162 length:1113 start_codon:yes stop_codon:yes gene_type:complete